MNSQQETSEIGFPPVAAAAIASSAYLVPYLISRSTAPSPQHPRIWAWYKSLRRPSYNPPDVAFPIAWLAIESGLAWSGYRLLKSPSSPSRNRGLALLAGNILGIGGWSRLFFGSRNLPLSTFASAALGSSAVVYVIESSKADKPAAAASIPLVAWVAFATVLTASIWRRNR